MQYAETGDKPMFKDMVARFLFVISVRHSRNTHRAYGQRLGTFETYLKDADVLYVEDISYKMVRSFFDHLRAKCSVATCNAMLITLRAFYRYCIRDCEMPIFDPTQKIEFLRLPVEPVTAMNEAEIQAMEGAATNDVERLLAKLPRLTGLRACELFGLKMEHVSFERRLILLPASLGKGAKGREIALRDDVIELLKRLRDSGVKGRIFHKCKSLAGLHGRFQRLRIRAGITREYGIHEARRTFATGLLRNGLDLKTVSLLLGHASISTTSRYISPASSEVVAQGLNALP